MNKEFVPYDIAIELKELGFDEECFRYRNNIASVDQEKEWYNWNQVSYFVSIPLFQQAFKWFREKYNLHSEIKIDSIPTSSKPKYSFRIVDLINTPELHNYQHDTYEEAEIECLKQLIKIVKDGA